MAIDANKTESGKKGIDAEETQDIINTMENQISILCKELMLSRSEFSAEDFVKKLEEYIETYDRILYTPISNYIYECYNAYNVNKAVQLTDNITENIKRVKKLSTRRIIKHI